MQPGAVASISLALSLSPLLLACAELPPPASWSSGEQGGSATTGGGGGGGGVGGAGGEGGQSAPGAPEGCSFSPVAVTGDVFDPDEVYFVGGMRGVSCESDRLLAHWSAPGFGVLGGAADSPAIRPTSGRLLHLCSGKGLCELRSDMYVYGEACWGVPLESDDVVLFTPPCSGYYLTLDDFRVSPEGAVIHKCNTAPSWTWYDASGSVVYSEPPWPDTPDPLYHLGHGNLALTRRRIVNLATGASVPIVGLPDRTVYTVRARPPDRFLLVLGDELTDDNTEMDLWKVDASGVAVHMGVFPPVPQDVKLRIESAKLDGCGALLQIGYRAPGDGYFILRRTLDGGSAVVFDTEIEPRIFDYLGALVTGP